VTIRISDELPKDWEQKSITLIGVVATLPEVTERDERFQFDVEMDLTNKTKKTLKVPHHISLNFYRETQIVKSENMLNQFNHFHAGERWQFTVRLKRSYLALRCEAALFDAKRCW